MLKPVFAAMALLLGMMVPASAQAFGNFSDSEASLTRMWQVNPGGDAVHLPTSFVCPAALGPLHRSTLWASDVTALNGNCVYKFDGGNLTILFEQFPAGLNIDMFEMFLRMTKMVEKDATPLPADQGIFELDLPWKHALFSLGESRRLGVWNAKFSSWNVSIKATFDTRNTQTILSALKDFAAPLKSVSEAQLAACGALQPPQPTGRHLDVERNEQALTNLATVAAVQASWMALPQTGPQAAKGPLNWCVQDVLGERGTNLSLIYYRHPPEDSGPLDRLVATDGSFAVIVIRDYLIKSDQAKANPPHYVYVESPEYYWLVGFYAGRPTLSELLHFVRTPNVTAYASIDRKDGNVALYGPGCTRPVINNGVFPSRMPEHCGQPPAPKPE